MKLSCESLPNSVHQYEKFHKHTLLYNTAPTVFYATPKSSETEPFMRHFQWLIFYRMIKMWR